MWLLMSPLFDEGFVFELRYEGWMGAILAVGQRMTVSGIENTMRGMLHKLTSLS